MSEYHLFTSESVSEGHPDKIADQLADHILDAVIAEDPHCRVACEVLVKTGMVLVAGEWRTEAWVDVEKIVRQTINTIGYTDSSMGFDGDACSVLTAIGKQSPDIARGVDTSGAADQGAGDQGLMFGYACRETSVFMPAPIYYAHLLMVQQARVRRERRLPWLRPDAKAQVTVAYAQGQPVAIDSVVVSTQHAPEVGQADLLEGVMEEIIKPVLPAEWLNKQTQYYINPTGRFVIGGPMGDCGLTGRKIIVDTYGGMARHGGGCFSGKDPSKVDRSASYMGRYIAKHIVAAGLADRCEVQLSYAIGVAEPVAVAVNTFGTGQLPDEELVRLIRKNFDMTPAGIIKTLDLLRPIYGKTAAYGHFGQETEVPFPWEVLDQQNSGVKS